MKKLILSVCVLILFISSLFTAYQQARIAFQSHIHVPAYNDSIDGIFSAYGEEISKSIPNEIPIVFLVPLNGFPDTATHPSFINARVVQEVMKHVSAHKKYLILSEGYTGNKCVSGAEATASMIGLKEGYNQQEDITVLLEKHATTTLENILNSKKILSDTFDRQEVALIIAGMEDIYPTQNIDVGHGARAFMFAKQNYASVPNIHIFGMMPTNMIDTAILSYPHDYNITTMYLGANGLLNLPVFDKKYEKKLIPGCIEAQQLS